MSWSIADVGLEKPTILDSADALHRMQEDIGKIAQALVAASSAEARLPAGKPAGKLDASTIRSIIRARRIRDRIFRGEMFSDPAWDMLLDLMAARLDGQRVAVSSLCIAAAVPPTTALRWIKTLCDQGIFVRRTDPEDSRRVYIELADETAKQMETFFDIIREIGMTPI
ncbi:MAG: MarR family transcriptional regulator [Allosphingosinicella sp.]